MKIIDIKPKLFYRWQKYCWRHLKKINIIVTARQHGKTYFVTELIRSFIYHPDIKNPEIVLMADSIKRVHKLYKAEFDEYFSHNSLYSWANDDITVLKFSRPDGGVATVHIIGTLKQPFNVKGLSPDLIVMDEAGLCHPETITEAAMPATDKSGGIIVVTGTVEDNWYLDLWLKGRKKIAQGSKNWFTFMVKFGDKWSKDVHNDAARKLILDKYDFDITEEKRKFDKEYMCDWFASSAGNIYRQDIAKAMEAERITFVPRLFTQKVGIAWDDGLSCTAVWFFQYHHHIARLIKYQEWRVKSTFDISGQIQEYLDSIDAKLGLMVTPHTMEARSQDDPNLITLKEKYCRLLNYHGRIIAIPRVSNKSIKEDALHSLLKGAIFDETTCAEGLRHISSFKLDVSRREADKHSHAVDALSELAMAYVQGDLDESVDDLEERPFEDEDMFFPQQTKSGTVLGPY